VKSRDCFCGVASPRVRWNTAQSAAGRASADAALSIANRCRLGDFRRRCRRGARCSRATPAYARPPPLQIDRAPAVSGLRELQGAAQDRRLDADLVLVAAHMRRNDRATALGR
jgi:hypothetical protein